MRIFFDQCRHTLRRLGRSPLFTLVTLLTLAIGVGANAVIFSVVHGVLLKPLPYPQEDRLIGVWYSAPGIGIPELNMAPFLYFTEREQSTTFEDIGVYDGDAFTITGTGQPEHIRGLDVTDGTLPLLGVQPVAGRLFTARDDRAGAPETVILSYGYWQQKFAGDPSVIGRTLIADGRPRQVIGVLPRNFQFLDFNDVQMIVPMQWDRSKTKLGNFSFRAIARLKPGVTMQQASSDVGRLLQVGIRSYPAPDGFSAAIFDQAKITPNLRPLMKDVVGDIGSVLWVLMASIGMVLLVACANVANLLLVRVEGRRQELAIRSALGAARGRIIGDLFIESLALGFTGSAIGLAIAYSALKLLVASKPVGLPRLNEIHIDFTVLLFTLGLALLVSALIGLIPVLKYSGGAINRELREGGRAISQSRERHRARKVLVVVQVALALVLLICSGLMIRTFRTLAHVPPGFSDPQSLQLFHIYIPDSQIPDKEQDRVTQMQQQIRDKLAAIPGVTAVSFSTAVPFDGRSSNDVLYAQDRQEAEKQMPPIRRFVFTAPQFFSTMGTPLIAGRDYTWTDLYQKRPVVIISENFAREYWQTPAAAIGKHLRVATTDQWSEVVGVVRDVYSDGVNKPAPTIAYWPVLQGAFEGQSSNVQRGVGFVIRTSLAGTQSLRNQIQQVLWSINPNLPLYELTTVGELYTRSMARTSFMLVMLCVAGSMALLLGIVGIYGVISYSVSQRTREIGIRMALGAQRPTLTGMFVRQGLILAGIGVVFGLGTAAAVMRLMSSLLFHVSPMDPVTYISMTATVILIAYLACYLPSRRAASVDPVNALRSE